MINCNGNRTLFRKCLCLITEAPAQVLSVEVIKTVGQSCLMIAWERPRLDELGCSNGTFVYGYRVGPAQEERRLSFNEGTFNSSLSSL